MASPATICFTQPVILGRPLGTVGFSERGVVETRLDSYDCFGWGDVAVDEPLASRRGLSVETRQKYSIDAKA